MSEVKQYSADLNPMIEFSPAAMSHVLSYLKKQVDSKGIRLSVKKTGCSGLSYVIDYVANPIEDDIISDLSEAYMLYVEKKSYLYLKGLHIDYVKQGINYKFVFTNPNQTGACGCGESFTVN